MDAEYDPELDELVGAQLVQLQYLGGPSMEMILWTAGGRRVRIEVVARVHLGRGYEPEAELDINVTKELPS